MTPMPLLPPNSMNGAQPPTDEQSAEEVPPQGDVTARQVHAQLVALEREVKELAKRYASFKPFADAISEAFTDGFFAIQEQLDASAQPQPTPRYIG